MATPTLEIESHTLPTHLRLKQRAQMVIARLSTLPKDHPIHDVIARGRTRSMHRNPDPQFPLAETMKTMNLKRLNPLEVIDPKPLALWHAPAFADIHVNSDREIAIEKS